MERYWFMNYFKILLRKKKNANNRFDIFLYFL